MEFKYKMWLQEDGQTIFGQGIQRLLLLVEETGSLHKAAAELKMSYRAAWGKIRDYEDRLGIDFLEKGRKGRSGAGLTNAGHEMLKIYAELQSEMQRCCQNERIMDLVKRAEELKNEE